MAGRTEGLIKSFNAEAEILPNRLIKVGTAAGSMLTAAAATDLIIGVSSNVGTVLTGEAGDGILGGIANVKAGGTIAQGALVTSDSTGRAIAATGDVRVAGVALQAGVINDIIAVCISISFGA